MNFAGYELAKKALESRGGGGGRAGGAKFGVPGDSMAAAAKLG